MSNESYLATGKLHVKGDTTAVSERFSKREFVLEIVDNPLYPQRVSFQFVQDICSLLDPFQVGQMIDIRFNLKGRHWTSPQGETKYFNTLEAWKIQASQTQPATTTSAPPPPPPEPVNVSATPDDSDLPF